MVENLCYLERYKEKLFFLKINNILLNFII